MKTLVGSVITEEVWQGVQFLLDHYAGVQEQDTAIVAYTPDSRECAAAVVVALESRAINTKVLAMAPLRDEGFSGRLKEVLPAPNTLNGKLIVLTFERDTMSHNSVLREALTAYNVNDVIVLRAISTCPELFSMALQVVPDELSARNTAILERCMTAKRLRITSASGTDLKVRLDPRHRWISNRGVWRPGNFVILPAGEVATFPSAIDGVLVADFAFNVNAITKLDSRLSQEPITVWIENGRATRYSCEDPQNKKFLDDCLETYCAKYVGELGLGTNPRIVDSIPMNSHINERRPGVHLGFGQHNQDSRVVEYFCKIHLDLITSGAKIWVDDDSLPIDLEELTPSTGIHPIYTHDEDVASPELEDLEIDDCCGLLTADGFELFDIERPSRFRES